MRDVLKQLLSGNGPGRDDFVFADNRNGQHAGETGTGDAASDDDDDVLGFRFRIFRLTLRIGRSRSEQERRNTHQQRLLDLSACHFTLPASCVVIAGKRDRHDPALRKTAGESCAFEERVERVAKRHSPFNRVRCDRFDIVGLEENGMPRLKGKRFDCIGYRRRRYLQVKLFLSGCNAGLQNRQHREDERQARSPEQ